MGKLAGLLGIGSNLLLFALKLLAGMLSGSIAIMADAVNNLSDCGSSVITLVGFHLSGIPADEKHPYGHARFEYISGLVVSALVLLIGFEFFKSSVAKIINPTPVAFGPLSFAILAASVVIKLCQGLFNKQVGETIQSGALAATAADSRNDALTTATVLVAALIMRMTGWNLDGWMGVAVAAFVLVSGGKLVLETLDPLLGVAPDRALVEMIQAKILGCESVIGMHDLVVHNYGPQRCFASVHVEMPANQDIMVSHDIIDNIERDFARQMDISLVIHLDPIDTDDARTNAMRHLAVRAVAEFDNTLSLHDFRMVAGKTHTNLIFDIVIPPRYKCSDSRLREEISRRIQVPGETIYCVITIDRSYTSTTQKLEQ